MNQLSELSGSLIQAIADLTLFNGVAAASQYIVLLHSLWKQAVQTAGARVQTQQVQYWRRSPRRDATYHQPLTKHHA